VRKLQRLPGNKTCADCKARAPQAANLAHGTFVCLPCCGVHREFSHRIKGVGHSAFTAEEASFLSNNGNDIVNAKYLANFSSGSERLRAPDGSAGAVDVQLLRVWLRRKYIDGAWMARSAPQQNGGGQQGQQNQHLQPTRAQIPPKKKSMPVQAQAPATDLLGGGWNSAPTPAPAPVVNDAAWDAFGQSRTTTSAPFQADFGSQPAVASPQPAFQADFGQMPMQPPPPAPAVQVQARAQMPHQSPDPPQQQASSFNPNFPQPSTPNRSFQPAPALSFPDQQLPSQPVQHQQMNGSSSLNHFNVNFQQQQSPAQNHMAAQVQPNQHSFHTNLQQQQQPPAPVQQAFNANFQQQQQPPAQAQQNQQAFNANFQQQQQPAVQMQQKQNGFNANFQQQQPQPTAQEQQNQQAFNANFQQQQPQPTAQEQQNQQAFNANFQQQQPQPTAQEQQNQQAFNANFQQQQPQPTAQEQQNQQAFNANFQQQQPQQHPAAQQAFNANFQQQQQPAVQMPKTEQGFDANFQQQQQQPSSQIQQTEQGFNANFQQQQQPPAQTQHSPAPDMQSSDSQTQPAPDVTAVPVPNQLQPSTGLQMSDNGVGVNNNLHSVPANGSSMRPSSAVGGGDSADPFDAFSSLSIGSSSLPPSEAPSMAIPSSLPPKAPVSSGLQFKVGEKLEYRDSQHNLSLVEVLKVHLDDELLPFYDIRLENGKEKQTDNAHLSVPSADMTASSSEAVVSKETMLANITALLGALDEKQLCTVENFLRDMQGIQG